MEVGKLVVGEQGGKPGQFSLTAPWWSLLEEALQALSRRLLFEFMDANWGSRNYKWSADSKVQGVTKEWT